MRSPYVARPATPALAGNGSRKSDRLARTIFTPSNLGQAQEQATCQHCRNALPKRKRGGAGRHQRFCSTACRVASSREKARFEITGYNHPVCYEIESRRPKKSNGCKTQNGQPYPCRFDVPLDILGRGYRWPGAPKLDRKTRAKILWREGCAP